MYYYCIHGLILVGAYTSDQESCVEVSEGKLRFVLIRPTSATQHVRELD